MKNYLEFLLESRYRTFGLESIKKIIPTYLKKLECVFDIIYNENTDDFSIYFSKIDDDVKNILLSQCELIGYFPSVFKIDNIQYFIDSKDIEDFKENIKKFNLPNNFKEVFFQFECYKDKPIETPKILYHICRTKDINEIKRYGIYPKSKNKISFHPDRIYFSDNLNSAKNLKNIFKKLNDNNFLKTGDIKFKNIDFSLVIINTDLIDNRYEFLVRIDPNAYDSYYTTQNVSPAWIEKIIENF